MLHIDVVLEACCAEFRIPLARLRSRRRTGKVVIVRRFVATLLREQLGLSFPRIGTVLQRTSSDVIYLIHGKPHREPIPRPVWHEEMVRVVIARASSEAYGDQGNRESANLC